MGSSNSHAVTHLRSGSVHRTSLLAIIAGAIIAGAIIAGLNPGRIVAIFFSPIHPQAMYGSLKRGALHVPMQTWILLLAEIHTDVAAE